MNVKAMTEEGRLPEEYEGNVPEILRLQEGGNN